MMGPQKFRAYNVSARTENDQTFSLDSLSCVVCSACGCHCSGKTPKRILKESYICCSVGKSNNCCFSWIYSMTYTRIKGSKENLLAVKGKHQVRCDRSKTLHKQGLWDKQLRFATHTLSASALTLTVSLSSLYRGV